MVASSYIQNLGSPEAIVALARAYPRMCIVTAKLHLVRRSYLNAPDKVYTNSRVTVSRARAYMYLVGMVYT